MLTENINLRQRNVLKNGKSSCLKSLHETHHAAGKPYMYAESLCSLLRLCVCLFIASIGMLCKESGKC